VPVKIHRSLAGFRAARSDGAMCAEQRIDHLAACDGKITWSVYFRKWGPSL
jgi:hypothetical protein